LFVSKLRKTQVGGPPVEAVLLSGGPTLFADNCIHTALTLHHYYPQMPELSISIGDTVSIALDGKAYGESGEDVRDFVAGGPTLFADNCIHTALTLHHYYPQMWTASSRLLWSPGTPVARPGCFPPSVRRWVG
jgi:hypothetical protein